MSAAHVLAGAIGGKATLQRHGREFFSTIGKLGGRPTWQQELERDRLLREQARKRNGRT